MITEFLIKVKTYFAKTVKKKRQRRTEYCVLVDSSNDTLIYAGTFPSIIVLLSEITMDSVYAVEMSSPDIPMILQGAPRTYPEWSCDRKKKIFFRTNPSIITEDMRDRAELVTKKGIAFYRAIYLTNRLREKLYNGLRYQETIYAAKQRQAQMLVDSHFDPKYEQRAPFVVQYADVSGMTVKDAAEDILLHAQLFNEHLEKTERFRLSLFRMIKSAKTPLEVDRIMENPFGDTLV